MASVGVAYAAAAPLTGNRIHDNATGVVSTVAGNVNGLGFVGVSTPNQIFRNTTGVQPHRPDAEPARVQQHDGRHRLRHSRRHRYDDSPMSSKPTRPVSLSTARCNTTASSAARPDSLRSAIKSSITTFSTPVHDFTSRDRQECTCRSFPTRSTVRRPATSC